MKEVAQNFLKAISMGLQRQSVQSPSAWACEYRFMENQFTRQDAENKTRWTFKYHPWSREMHDSEAPENYGQKAAQMGYTEWLLNKSFFAIDVKRENVLYVLPSKTPDASDFSAARFDPALELSEHLKYIFSDVKNVGHKRAGNANLYIRGSQTKSALKSIPVSQLFLDEYDEMVQENIPLAKERVSGQFTYSICGISTPTIDDFGINLEYKRSSKESFYFKCPRCSRTTTLIFPDCLKITGESLNDPKLENSHIVCKECKGELDHRTKFEWLAKGYWIPEDKSMKEFVRGFYINQLFSSTVKPYALARSVIKADSDPTEEQELYNSKMGLPKVIDGARLTEEQIKSLRGSYPNGKLPGQNLVTMGVDVGKWFHVEIDEWFRTDSTVHDANLCMRPKLLLQTKVRDPKDLVRLMVEYGVVKCVIDAQPERRIAYDFALKFWGRVRMCFYSRSQFNKQIDVKTSNKDEPIISVNRTAWLDVSYRRFDPENSASILLPKDLDDEYISNLMALTRVYDKDKDGNPVGRYLKSTKHDHYAHARCYSEIALRLAMANGATEDMPGII